MSGGGGSQTVSNDPWSGQEDFLIGSQNQIYAPEGQQGLAVQGLMPRAYQASFQPRSFFPGQIFANWSPQTNQAMAQSWRFGQAPSGVESAANQQIGGTAQGAYMGSLGTDAGRWLNNQAIGGRFLQGGSAYGQPALNESARGDFLYGGPGFNRAYQAAANQVIPQVSSLWSGAGRYGSGLAQEAQTRALGDIFAGQYGQERQNQLAAAQGLQSMYGQERQLMSNAGQQQNELWAQERGRQLMAAGMAPQTQAMEQQRLAALSGVGQATDAQSQRYIDEQMQRHDFGQNEPYERLNWFNSILQPGNVYRQQTTSGGGGSTAASLLGGGLSGLGLGASLAGLGGSSAGAAAGLGFLASPWTLPIAAGAGLLGGLL